ncbi:hypothetical protein DSM107133_03704 (plasmid) [Pseudosulfitobacter sp. DSM 107133]|nr:hypothetical protein DSM107133_03704 [Pseudosulfitobacter sp. DSM 107133]
MPKYVVSTIAFSGLIGPDPLSADIQMILWAGGLYGLNDICMATLGQAAGAVYGAAQAAVHPKHRKVMTDPVTLHDLDCHINDVEFAQKVLEIVDRRVADGTIKMEV